MERVKKFFRQALEILRCVGWAMSHMADAEMQYHLNKNRCSNCGHMKSPSGGAGMGPG